MRYLLLLLTVGLAVAGNSPVLAQSPGDTIGSTEYTFQTQGSTGHRIAVDNQGSVHFAWMNGDPYPSTREIYYNYIGAGGSPWPQLGTAVSYRNGDGYAQIALTGDNRAVVVYHYAPVGSESLFCAIDMYPGLGEFQYFHPPNRVGSYRHIWPFVAVDRNDIIHIVATGYSEDGLNPFSYRRTEDGGRTWVVSSLIDYLRTVSPMITASPVSDKVAIAFCDPTDSTQIRNNIFYIESQDGTNWDFFGDAINITGYEDDNDSLYAFNEVDAAYDYNDNLHIVWNAQRVTARGIGSDRVFLYHFDAASETITEITRADVPHLDSCRFGGYNLAINRVSIAADSANDRLYVVYCKFDTSDCARSGEANGELYLQMSQNDGDSWSGPLNLTNSPSPNCVDGDCYSDLEPSLAERVDDYIHIFYYCYRHHIDDPVRDDLMLYLRLPVDELRTEDDPIPHAFGLFQNYPNPFNAQTTLKYNLKEKSAVDLSIYGITGQKVNTLCAGMQEAGEHKIVWDAKDVSSGIYFARLSVEGNSQSIRMTLLK